MKLFRFFFENKYNIDEILTRVSLTYPTTSKILAERVGVELERGVDFKIVWSHTGRDVKIIFDSNLDEKNQNMQIATGLEEILNISNLYNSLVTRINPR